MITKWWKRQGDTKTDRLRKRDFTRLLGTGCVITLCVVFLGAIRPPLFEHIENKTFDVLFSQTSLRPPSQVPVLISIDDKALSRLGQWPWPRNVLAKVISRLQEAGANVVALDLVLSSRDQTSPKVVLESLTQSSDLAKILAARPLAEYDFDHVLSKALKSLPSVLGYKLLFTETSIQQPCILSSIQSDQTLPSVFDLHEAFSAVCTLPSLARASASTGFINASYDSDGVIRRIPLVALHESSILPSLTLALASLAEEKNIFLGQNDDGGFVQLGINRIQTDPQGNMFLRFRGPSGTFRTISAADILDRPLPNLIGNIAIIGPTAAGLGDIHITPLDRTFPGIEVHATALDNILQADFLIHPSWAAGAEAATVIIVGILSSIFIIVSGPLTCVLSLAAGILGLWSASLWLLNGPGYWISPLQTVLVLILNLSVLSLIKYGIEEHKLRLQNQQLLQAQDATILGLTSLAETRDKETGGHIERTQEYVRALAESLAQTPKYRGLLDQDFIELLYKCAPLHDIGKVGIADSILLKPDRLTNDEYIEMQRHTILGADTLAKAASQSKQGTEKSFLILAKEIALSHHEKWDGSGYPYGLAGSEIPLGARLMALADVYDALVNKRVYKEAISHENATEIIINGKGKHFDPDIVDAFIQSKQKFQDILNKYT